MEGRLRAKAMDVRQLGASGGIPVRVHSLTKLLVMANLRRTKPCGIICLPARVCFRKDHYSFEAEVAFQARIK